MSAARRAELLRLELELANRSRTAGEPGAHIAAEFVEFGSSGRTHTRADVVAWLAGPPEEPFTLTEFRDRELAPDVVLVTYRAERRTSEGTVHSSMRSSIWKWSESRWQMVFHQGTAT
ncbi:MAG: DUF4440 domain-containing protein [Acidobacteriota bacterium]